MLGNLIANIREKKGLTKSNLADLTGINVGHITHVEKGERNLSTNALRDICKALDIPYQPLSYLYDKKLTENQERFNLATTLPYNTIPLVSNIEDMVVCPSTIPNASIAFIMNDDAMKSSLPKGSIAYLELSAIPEHRELGLFSYKNSILVRKLVYRKNKIVLKADNLLTKDITIEDMEDFCIIGKIYVEN